MQAVLEIPALTTEPPWPVPPHTPYSWLPLDGTRSAETALFVAAIADSATRSAPDEDGPLATRGDRSGEADGPLATPGEWGAESGEAGLSAASAARSPDGAEAESVAARVIDGLVRAEMLIVAGGLRLHDSVTGATVVPGCCAGLEDWRDWALVAAGESPWLGHDPSPRAEALPGHARIWQNGHAGPTVDVPWTAFPELLAQVHRDLAAFEDRLAEWGAHWGDRGAALVAKIHREFAMTAPLRVPMR